MDREMTTSHDTAEVELEDYGSTSMLRRIGTVLAGQHGTLTYRFVARRGGRDGEVIARSPTFPVLAGQLPLDDLDPRAAFGPEMTAALDRLDASMAAAGWRRAGRGDHWWSRRYIRSDRPPAGGASDAR